MRKIKSQSTLDAEQQKAIILREGRRVTSYDVAMVAGVSQSAVSRCFKPGASVSESTYARVMAAAAGLDYIPNAAARSLITRRSNMVAILISRAAMLYNPQALNELSQELNRRGKRALLFTFQIDAEVDHILSEVWQFQVDGVIAATALTPGQVAEFHRRRVPMVVFNRLLRDQNVSSVLCDQYESSRMLVTRLAQAGHRQFGVISGPTEHSLGRERLRGALDGLQELGLPAPLVYHGSFDYASGVRGIHDIVARHGGPPHAVLCGSDPMAMGCLDAARQQLGIEVPGQMSVAGFDAVEGSDWLSYKLSTLCQPLHKMALATADLLCRQIDAPGEWRDEQRVFAAQLVEGTTARFAPPAADALAA